MIIPIVNYAFDGPLKSVKKIEDRPGVFVVACEFIGKHYLLDVDHSDKVKTAILSHERKKCWKLYRRGLIRYAVLYTDDKSAEERRSLEKRIRKKYKTLPCGGSPDE